MITTGDLVDSRTAWIAAFGTCDSQMDELNQWLVNTSKEMEKQNGNDSSGN